MVNFEAAGRLLGQRAFLGQSHPQVTVKIKDAISNLVERKRRFTGHDVCSIAVSGFASSRDVSTKVRELFNAHDPCFAGYACFPIPGGGPLLYFYAGAEVIRRGQDILDTIRSAEAAKDPLRYE